MLSRCVRFFVTFFGTKKQSIDVGGQKESWINPETLEYNFAAIEKSVVEDGVGFGNPDSKWTVHEQFLLWKKMIQSGRFQNRDAYCNILVTYSSYQQALEYLGLSAQ